MRYPTLSRNVTERIVIGYLRNSSLNIDVNSDVNWVGNGDYFELSCLEDSVRELKRLWSEADDRDDKVSRDRLEGKGAIILADKLKDAPVQVLDDPGFWRYVSVVHFWWFIEWRESNAFIDPDVDKVLVYVDGRRSSECVPLRMYLRGRISLAAGEAELASAVPQATDFWRSHIVRVNTSYAPAVVGELIRLQAEPDCRMTTETLRDFAKRLNRVASNVVLPIYERRQAHRLIRELSAATRMGGGDT